MSAARLLDTTTALVHEGIALPAILATGRELQAGLDKLASLFMELVITPVLDRHGGPPPPQEVARLAETIERLRPVAQTALDAEFARAMDRRARASYREFIRLLAADPGQAIGREAPAAGSELRGPSRRIQRRGNGFAHITGQSRVTFRAICTPMPVITGMFDATSEARGMRRARDLAGQVVVITGAARGIGAWTARRLAARDAQVALLGLEPGELADGSARCGPRSRWWQVDVTDGRALAGVAAEVRDAYGRIDVVVANAGIAVGGPFIHSDPGAFARVIEVNLLGSVATARAFLPALLESEGYLLQVASLAALTPAPMMAAYCASKAGVEAFAHAVRAEVAHRGVRVGVAYLSWTDTDMVRGADENPALRQMRAGLPFPAQPHQSRRGGGRRPHRRDREACTTGIRAALAAADAAGQGAGIR